MYSPSALNTTDTPFMSSTAKDTQSADTLLGKAICQQQGPMPGTVSH